MKCPYCGKIIPHTKAICPYCFAEIPKGKNTTEKEKK